MARTDPDAARVFTVILIRPTHYDDRGYPIRWLKSQVPSGSLACLHGLVLDCQRRQVLGDDVDWRILTLDETNRRVDPDRLIDLVKRAGGRGLVAFVGVQSCQFPRTMDLARPIVAAGIPVCVGGFHVTGCFAMLPDLPPELVEAQRMGASLFVGEAEGGRLDEVLEDAYAGKLRPLYHHLAERPSLEHQPTPILPWDEVRRTQSLFANFDIGRGCPFRCSFCTVINVQGTKSRYRTPDDLERIIRQNYALGVRNFFVTDDNLARNANWEPLLDRLIELRERDGLKVRLLAQVDMQSHRVPRFVEKAVRAGFDQLFVGLESIDPDNLKSVSKPQNRIDQYREMLLAWKRYPVVITAGYIIGFPNDTPESIFRAIDTIQQELPVDHLNFTYLTPLPGSEDHRRLREAGTFMDPDLNQYDANHRVTHHPRMSDAQWDDVYRQAWLRYYTPDHMERVVRRMVALRSNKKLTTINRMTWFRDYVRLCGVHPFDGGVFRIQRRRDRRPGLPIEPAHVFYPRYARELLRSLLGMGWTHHQLKRMLRGIWTAPDRYAYTDQAIAGAETARRQAAPPAPPDAEQKAAAPEAPDAEQQVAPTA